MLEWVSFAGDNADLSEDAGISVVAKVFKIIGRNTFDIDDKKVLAVCSGDGCSSCFIKKRCKNVSTPCNKCKHKKHNDKRCDQKEKRKEERDPS